MSRFLKKIIAVLLAISFCITCVPLAAVAEESQSETTITNDNSVPQQEYSEQDGQEPEGEETQEQEEGATIDGSDSGAGNEEGGTSAPEPDTTVVPTEAPTTTEQVVPEPPAEETYTTQAPPAETPEPTTEFPSTSEPVTEIPEATPEAPATQPTTEQPTTTQEATSFEEATSKTFFTYEDPEIIVEVTLDEEAALPAETEFYVRQIFENSIVESERNTYAWSEQLLDKHFEKEEIAAVNTFFYDMYFELNGQKIRPDKEFKVEIEYKKDKVLDEEATADNVRIFYIDDNDFLNEPEVVDTKAKLEVNEFGSVTTAEFQIKRYLYTPLMICMIESKEAHEERLAREEAEGKETETKSLIYMEDPTEEETSAEDGESKIITDEDEEGNEGETEAETETETEEEPVPTRSYYASWSGDVSATIILSNPAQVPDTAEVVVTPVTPDAEDYNYDAYIEALNSSDESINYTAENTLLYDIKFVDTVINEDGEEQQIEYEPEEGTVQVILKFKNNQLSNEINAEDNQNVTVNHLVTDAEADTTEISAGDISVVGVDAEVQLKGTDTVTFNTENFSVYAFSYTVDFHWEVNGKEYQFTIPGGGFVSFTDLVEALGLNINTNYFKPAVENDTVDYQDVPVTDEIDYEDIVPEEVAESGVDAEPTSDEVVIPEADEIEVENIVSEEVAESGINTEPTFDEVIIPEANELEVENVAPEEVVGSDVNTELISDEELAPITPADNVVSDTAREFVANVANVEFSNPSLVDVSWVEADTTVGQIKESRGLEVEYSAELTEDQIAEIDNTVVESGDWALISVQPFTSEEILTVTMNNGEMFVIKVTDAQIKKTVIDAKGDTWEIIVTYGEDAQIPDGAELNVEEILPEDEEYDMLLSEAENVLEEANSDPEEEGRNLEEADENSLLFPALFDISICVDGKEIEPAKGSEVLVEIKLIRNRMGYNEDVLVPRIYNGSEETSIFSEVDELNVIHHRNDGDAELEEVTTDLSEEYITASLMTDSFSNWTVTGKWSDTSMSDARPGDTIAFKGGDDQEHWYNDNGTWKSYVDTAGYWTFSDPYRLLESREQRGTDDFIVAKIKDNAQVGQSFTATFHWNNTYYNEYWQRWETVETSATHTITIASKPQSGSAPRILTEADGIVSNSDVGITLNLFDYDLDRRLDERFNNYDFFGDFNPPYNGYYSGHGINAGKTLKFTGSGSTRNDIYNDYTAYSVSPNMVETNLSSSGYPVLTGGNGSLDYLFSTTAPAPNQDKAVYQNVDGLFQYKDGYYQYDSNTNFAHLNGNKFDVYAGTYNQHQDSETGNSFNPFKAIGFFPFDEWNDAYNLYVNWNKNLNHHFGMHMSVDFNLPGGDKAVVDPNGNDIVFEFSGDDDMWVFVDGKLVLDIGGIHQPLDGRINFTQGTTTSGTYQLDTSKTTHKLEVFYLERGGCDSNCKIKFNTILYKDLEFDKVDQKNVKVPNAKFALYTDASCTTPLTEWIKQGTNGKTQRHMTAESDENGHVKFTGVPVGTYYMKETVTPNGYRENNTIYTVKVTPEGAKLYNNTTEISQVVNVELTEVQGTKTWYDSSPSHDYSTDITLTLYRKLKDQTDEEFVQVEGANPVWDTTVTPATYTFANLDKYNENGNEYVYDVQETVNIQGKTYHSEKNGFHFINTELTERHAEKEWDDNNNQDNTRPGSITFTLKATAGNAELNLAEEGIEPADITIIPNDEGVWPTADWTDLPAFTRDGREIIYDIVESDVSGSSYTLTGKEWNGTTATFTNTYGSAQTEITGKKEMKGGNTPADNSYSFILSAPNGTPMPATGEKVIGDDTTSVTVKNTGEDFSFGTIKYTVNDMDEAHLVEGSESVYEKTFTYTVTEKDESTAHPEIVYDKTVFTVTVTIQYDTATGELSVKETEYEKIVEGSEDPGAVTVIKFVNEELTEVNVIKAWTPSAPSDTEIELSLYKESAPDTVISTIKLNGKKDVKEEPNSDEEELLNGSGNAETAFEVDAWKAKWTDLPKYEGSEEITYIVKETKGKDGYTVTYANDKTYAINGGTITNKLNETDIKIVKVKEGTTIKLSGAIFQLRIKVGDEYVKYSDACESITVDEDAVVDKLIDGEYQLTEIQAPAGYIELLTPIEFTIKNGAVVTPDWVDDNNADGSTVVDYTPKTDDDPATFTVGNKPGSPLPFTGGIGTTLFTILGALLACTAAFMLIWNQKRKRREN